MNQRLYDYQGEQVTLTELSRRSGIPLGTIRGRLALGWTLESAVSKPVNVEFSHRRAGRRKLLAPRPCPPLQEHSSGRAFVRWSVFGREYFRYFGAWGSPEVEEAYRRFMIDWARGMAHVKQATSDMLVCELVEAYLIFAKSYYVKNGRQTSEFSAITSAATKLVSLFGGQPTNEINADDLRALQHSWVQDGLMRKTITGYQQRIVRMFRWGCTQLNAVKVPFVSPDVAAQLAATERLKPKRSEAPESEKVTAVPWENIEAIFPHFLGSKTRRDILEACVRVGYLVGCRPGELVSMRLSCIDRSKPEWRYIPREHKTEHLGHDRSIWIGPKAQAVIMPLLDDASPDRAIFALPAMKGGRLIEMSPEFLQKRIREACKRAGIEPWTPHQLRHARATVVQRIYESDKAAAAAIGDTEEVTRRVYIDPNDEVARRIARETG